MALQKRIGRGEQEFWISAARQGALSRAGGTVRHPIALEFRHVASAAFLSADDLAGPALSLALTDMIGYCGTARHYNSTNRDSWLLRLRDFLDANCVEPFELFRLVEVTGRHPAHISRAFRCQFGKSISQFVMECRVLRAVELLWHDRAR